ncbi:MAG: hypothetical protein ABSA68_11655 [Xanthobacteraceae bacterium]|jgi:hypothetical protein
MSKFRTSHDAPKRPPTKPTDPPGTLPDNKIPIIDHKGNARGSVGHLATQAVVSRFGVTGAKIGKHEGRTAWVEPKPSPPKPPLAQIAKRAGQLRQAKGSVGLSLAQTSALGATDFKSGGGG